MSARTDDPMQPNARLIFGGTRTAPCCGARTRAGTLCHVAAMRNGRCRMHGGRSTGPRTPEGLERMRAAKTKHGFRSAAAADARALIREIRAGAKRLDQLI
jgi:hypothetical protein